MYSSVTLYFCIHLCSQYLDYDIDYFRDVQSSQKVLCLSFSVNSWKCLCPCSAAKSLQSCPTLCNPIDGSPTASPVPGILQARTLEWGAIAFSKAWKWKVKVTSLSHVRPLVTPWTAAHQAPPSMGLSRQEDWSGVPSPSPVHSTSASQLHCR